MSDLTAEQWNAAHPIGTPVTAYPGIRPEYAAEIGSTDYPRLETRTRSQAWNLGHGEPVVAVEGYAGGISLEHIDLRTEEDQPMNQPANPLAGHRRALDALLDWLIAKDEAETEATGGCPACDTQHDEMCVACGSCRCDRHDTCTRPAQEA